MIPRNSFISSGSIQSVHQRCLKCLRTSSGLIDAFSGILNRYTTVKYYAMTRLQPTSLEQLEELITEAMDEHGNRCSLNHIDVSRITDMSFLFSESQFDGDISQWDVSNVTNMRGMFSGAVFTGDISTWDTSSVVSMSNMFQGTAFQGDISRWDTANVQDMTSMFAHSSFNGDISKWNVGQVTNMSYMFLHSQFNGDISNWNTSKVARMGSMFSESIFQGDISRWDVSNVTDMTSMFRQAAFKGDLSNWMLHPEAYSWQAFSQWHDSPLGILGVLNEQYEFPKTDPRANRFKELQGVAETMGLEDGTAAYYIFQQLRGGLALQIPEMNDFRA